MSKEIQNAILSKDSGYPEKPRLVGKRYETKLSPNCMIAVIDNKVCTMRRGVFHSFQNQNFIFYLCYRKSISTRISQIRSTKYKHRMCNKQCRLKIVGIAKHTAHVAKDFQIHYNVRLCESLPENIST